MYQMNTSKRFWLNQLAVASLYLFFGMLVHHYITDNGIVSILWPGSGIALAAVLMGGRRYLWGVLLGSFALNVVSNTSLWAIGGITVSNVLEAYLGLWLLKRNTQPGYFLDSLPDYLRLLGLGGAVANIAGASLGALSLLLAGIITPASYFENVWHWWMGDTLGVVLFTPFVLAWGQTKIYPCTKQQCIEPLLLIFVTFIAGQIVFLGWFQAQLSDMYKGYFMFIFVSWVAIRLNVRWLTLVLLIVAIQALLGAYQGVGVFAQDIARTALQSYWAYMLILSGVGMSLATYVKETRKNEAKLKESESQLLAIIESEPECISILNAEGRLLQINPTGLAMIEADSLGQVIGCDVLDLISPEYRNEFIKLHADVLAGKTAQMQLKITGLKGSSRWLETSAVPLQIHGKTAHLAVTHDITDRKLVEEQLRLAAITFQTSEAIMITDADANIMRVNPSFEHITGYAEAEVLGKNPRIFSSGRHDRAFYTAMWQTIISVGRWQGEVWDKHKNGTIYLKQLSITAVKNINGETTQYVANFSSLSVSKQAEEDLRKTESHFVTILNSLDEIIWSASAPDFKLRHISAATEKLYGLPQQAFMDDHELWFKMIHPDDQQRVMETTQPIFKLGKTEIEYRIIRNDGQTRWLSDRMYVVYGEDGQPTELVGTAYDVTEYKLAEDAVRDSQRQLLHLLETSPIAVRIAASSGHNVLFANNSYAKLINCDPTQTAGKDPQHYYAHPQDYAEILQQLNHGISVTDKLVELSIPGIGTIWAIASYHLIDYQNEPAVLGWFYDVTDLRKTQESLRQSEQQAKLSLEELKYQKFALDKHAIVAVTDVQGRITHANEKFCEISGYSREELIGQDHAILNSGYHAKGYFKDMYRDVANGKVWHDEVCNRAKDGHLYWVDTTIAPVMGEDGKPQGYISIRTDITNRKAAEEKSNYLALYDTLTQLPNRRLLMDRLNQAIASSARSGRGAALLFLDLDHFKTLNDTLGHDIGDALLQQVAKRLTSCVREGDTVARLGGDEFLVLLEDLSENATEAATHAEEVGEKILNILNQQYQLGTHEYRSTSSIGAALLQGHTLTLDELIKQADIAMYQAKQAGRNTLRFFDPKMQASISARVDLEHELHKALDQQQFQLHYQIQVDKFGKALGAEALIRWLHPERGMISPFHFITLAEETGLIIPIGNWVLDTGCAQLKLWQQNPATRDLSLSVNVSAKQFLQADFVTRVLSTVQRHGINPSSLKLELTESMLVDNVDGIIATMNTLAKTGISFSLDDFGTGYSSLQYLKKLPLYQLKIDQSFVRDIATDSSDRALVRTIIAMAHILDLSVIAEGVETEEQREFLLEYDCTHYQGYLFSKPVAIEQFDALLAAENSESPRL